MINKYPEGSDITIFNTIYHRMRKDPNTNKWIKNSMDIIYRDNLTGDKKLETIKKPEYEYYLAKPEVEITHNMLYIEKDKVDKLTVEYNDLEKSIAEKTDNLQFYYDNINSGQRSNNKKLHTHMRVFNSDMHIEDHYRFKFDKLYTNNTFAISKAYLDIEVDSIEIKGDFPEPGEVPVNAITVIDESNNRVYTLLLRNPKNPLIQEFENSIGQELFLELKNFICEQVGGWKEEIRFGIDKFQYQMMFYDEDDEINLIGDCFKIINTFKPDFVLAWNMGFDIPYLIERIKVLGYDPADVICHPDFENKVCSYFKDDIDRKTGKFKKEEERGDEAIISSYSVYLDQMIQFASRRKGQSVFDRFSLDYIGEVVTGVNKLDYHHITNNISKLPYANYKIFVFYNIIDTIVQKCIESKTGDIDYIFNKCLINNTRYSKGHRQTVYLTNRGCKEFDLEGYIMGNNVNKTNSKPDDKFPGAFVADPIKINDYSKKRIGDMSVNLFDNLDDYDYSSLYPSIMREFNMSQSTQIGRIDIKDKIYMNENPFNSKYYIRGGAFIEDFHSKNYLEFGHRWLNLSGYSDLYKEVIEYFTTVKRSVNPVVMYNENGTRNLLRNVSGLKRDLLVKANDNSFRPLLVKRIKTPEYLYNEINKIDVREVIYSE